MECDFFSVVCGIIDADGLFCCSGYRGECCAAGGTGILTAPSGVIVTDLCFFEF